MPCFSLCRGPGHGHPRQRCVSPRGRYVLSAPRCQLPLLPAERRRAMLRGFACLSSHSGDAPAPEGLSPESVVTLCPLLGQRQSCEPGPFPKPGGVQNRGPGWGWGLPAWSWALAKAGSAWAAAGDPQGCTETRSRSGKRWFSSRMVLRGASAVPTPLWWPCLQGGLCPCVFCIPWRHWEARSVPSVQGRGTVSPVPCPFPSSWPLQRALLASCLRAAPQPRAEQTPRSPAPACQLCACPASECPWCL